MPRRAARALLCTLALVAGLLAVSTDTAAALGSDDLTRGVVGYGTVHVAASTPPADCTAPAANPGATSANVNAGQEYDCASFASGGYDTCTGSTDTGFSCHITLQAQVPDPGGWRFDHWSGDCSGSSTSCTIATSFQDCDPESKPICRPMEYFGPFTAVAHFVDTRAPSTTLAQAPANNSVVYSDSGAQQFTWATNEAGEAPFFGCKRDAGSFSACSSGLTWSAMADGIHDFCVHAVDASGLMGADTCRHWQQESNPTASIVTHPAATTGTPVAAFGYTSNKAGHPADGSTLAYLCKLDAGAFEACPAGGESYSLLANGAHTFQVEAVFTAALGGGAHTSPAATYTWTQADTTGPTITLTSTPDSPTTNTDATVAWTGSEPDEQQTFTCKVDDDPAGYQPCTSPMTLAGLSDGTHHLYVQGKDFLGNLGPTATATWTVDTTAPTVALHAPAPFTLSGSQKLSWTGDDGGGSGVADYRVRSRRASATSGFGAWTAPSAWQSGARTSMPLAVGFTYCFEVQAQDEVGQVSAWSAARCVTRALDDRALRATGGWTRAKSPAFYLGTYTSTSRTGATLSISGVRLDRAALVATRCPSCGTVAVYAGAKLIKKVNLHSSATHRKAVIALPELTLRTTTVKIKVLSSGRTVQIDGLALSRA